MWIIKSGDRFVSIRAASVAADESEARVRIALSDYAHIFDDGELAHEVAATMREGGNAADVYRLELEVGR